MCFDARFVQTALTIGRFGFGEDGQENIPHRDWLLAFDKVVQEVKEEMKSQGREDEFVGAKVHLPT